MIREPYSVYPYNITIDTSTKSSTDERTFSFIFNGGQLRQYDYEIIENNNSRNVYKKFDALKNVDGGVVYNDTEVKFTIPAKDSAIDKNWIWKLRLVENKGDWTSGNIPTMRVQNGEITKKSGSTFEGILAGTIEQLDTFDLQEGTLSVKTDDNKTYRLTSYESRYYEYYTYGIGGFFTKSGGDWNKKDEILYSVEENLLQYGDKFMTQYKAGTLSQYPKETPKKDCTRAYINTALGLSLPTSIEIKDENGAVISDIRNTTYFTKDEIDLIEDKTYGIYTIAPFGGGAAVDLSKSTAFYLYKNFYDTNYYYFQSRNKPVVTFVDENRQDLKYSNGTLNLDNRYFVFNVKEQDNIDTKFYWWDLYRNDSNIPILTTNKTFSQNITLTYENFLNDYSYRLVLHLSTQDDANYDYEIPNIFVHYDENIKMYTSAYAHYDQDDGYVSITWPTQKLSIPTVNGAEPDPNWKDKNGKITAYKVPADGSIVYDNLLNDTMRIDPDNFILSTCFYVDENMFRTGEPKIIDILSLESTDGQNFLKVRKNGLSMRIITPRTAPGGVAFYKLESASKGADGNFSYDFDRDTFLNLLMEIPDFAMKDKYVKDENIFNYFRTPAGSRLLYESNYDLYETDTNMNVIKMKLFIARQGAFIRTFHYNPKTKGWAPDGDWVINNQDVTNRYNLKMAYYNIVKLLGPASFKYLTIYTLRDITHLIDELEPGILDLEWSPNWDTIPDDKMLQVDFGSSVRSAYDIDIDGIIKSYRIYRFEYDNEEKSNLLSQTLLAEKEVPDLTHVNNDTFFLIKDYTAHNRGYFEYQITPRTESQSDYGPVTKVLGKAMISDLIYINDYHWIFTSIGKRADGTYTPIEQWKFLLNLTQGDFSHNLQKVYHTGFARYPKASVGTTNYITTSLSCLVGDLKRQHNRIYTGLRQYKGTMPMAADIANLTHIYIQQTDFLSDLDVQVDSAAIIIRAQERKIVNYGFDYINGQKIYFVDINTPFTNFIPGMTYGDYEINVIKDKNNEVNYDEVGETNIYTDTINIVNNWNTFIDTYNLILCRDIKGNCFICSISDNTESYDINIDQIPTTVNFTITQIDTPEKYIIYGD